MKVFEAKEANLSGQEEVSGGFGSVSRHQPLEFFKPVQPDDRLVAPAWAYSPSRPLRYSSCTFCAKRLSLSLAFSILG